MAVLAVTYGERANGFCTVSVRFLYGFCSVYSFFEFYEAVSFVILENAIHQTETVQSEFLTVLLFGDFPGTCRAALTNLFSSQGIELKRGSFARTTPEMHVKAVVKKWKKCTQHFSRLKISKPSWGVA